MKKRNLASLALLGIGAGLMLGGCQNKATPPRNAPPGSGPRDKGMEQMSSDMQAFYSSLSPEAQKKFMQLDAQHKMMAIEMANQGPNEKNKCAAMGGCKTTQHDCAGENGCKGQGGPAIKDPNKAVDVQYKNQTKQRQKTNGNMGGSGSGSSYSGSSQSSPPRPMNPPTSSGSTY